MKLNMSTIGRSFRAHSPLIFTCVGIVGMVVTVVTAVKATPKAMDHIKEAEEEKGEPLTKFEMVKACYKDYIPTAIAGVASAACVATAQHQNADRNAALSAACVVGNEAYQRLKTATEKVVPDKIAEINDQMAKDAVSKANLSARTPEMSENPKYQGPVLCYDPLIDRPFWSDITKIKKAELAVRKALTNGLETFECMNDFYDGLGLKHVECGDYLGWTPEYLIDLSFTSMLDEDDNPMLVIVYQNPPKPYKELMGR